MGFGKLIAGVALSVCLAAVAQAKAPSRAQLAKITPGMTRAALFNLIGDPDNRETNGPFEALQYCSTGMVLTDTYTTIFLKEGKVLSHHTQNLALVIGGPCREEFPPVNWGRVDAGDPASKIGGSQSGGGTATGTAFKVGPTTLVTASHVVEGTTKIEVICPGMAVMPATIVQRSGATDIAVLSVPTDSAKWLPLASTAEVALGDPVFVIGFPVSDLLGANPRYNDGTVSALSGIDSDASFLQISAPIQPGNSGGPVISPTRGVVGVVSSSAAAAAFLRGTGGALPQNINFAARADLSLSLDRTLKTGSSPVSVADAVASTCFVRVQLAS
jgi:S1-C subfamily serine protease